MPLGRVSAAGMEGSTGGCCLLQGLGPVAGTAEPLEVAETVVIGAVLVVALSANSGALRLVVEGLTAATRPPLAGSDAGRPVSR